MNPQAGEAAAVRTEATFGNLHGDGAKLAVRLWDAHTEEGRALAGVGQAQEGYWSSNWGLSHCLSTHYLQHPRLDSQPGLDTPMHSCPPGGLYYQAVP